MGMKTLTLSGALLIVILLPTAGFGQQRIGVELTSRFTNVNTTIYYSKVIRTNWILSGGVLLGSFNSNPAVLSSESPFSGMNQPFSDSIGTFSLNRYSLRNQGFGIQYGVGYFREFGTLHGIRFNLNQKWLSVQSQTKGVYVHENFAKYRTFSYSYASGSLSAEVYHTLRLSPKWTFYYGVKLNYYFLLDKGRYNPHVKEDPLSGFEPELAFGVSRSFGKCD